MRILFLGSANSPLVHNLARELRQHNSDWKIDIVADGILRDSSFRECFDEVVELNDSKWYRQIKYLRIVSHAFQCASALKKLKRVNSYDHVHIFFLYPSYGLFPQRILDIAGSVFISVFGSEFYRTSPLEKWLQGRIATRATKVLASTDSTLTDFSNYYKVPKERQFIRLFGLKALDFIQPLSAGSRSSFKSDLGIDPSKIVVTCGYNAAHIQNHKLIIRELSKHKNELPSNLFLIFPMTMGGTRQYIEEVRAELVESGFDFLLLDKFLSNKGVADLRSATDVMIQLQSNDQLSGAMLEHLYAQNALITGSWLHYDLLKKNNLHYYTIESIADLSKKLSEVIEQLPSTEERRFQNRSFIWSVCGWSNAAEKWSDLYKNDTM